MTNKLNEVKANIENIQSQLDSLESYFKRMKSTPPQWTNRVDEEFNHNEWLQLELLDKLELLELKYSQIDPKEFGEYLDNKFKRKV